MLNTIFGSSALGCMMASIALFRTLRLVYGLTGEADRGRETFRFRDSQALGQSRVHLASQNKDKTKLHSTQPAGLRFALLFLLLFLCLFNCLAEFRHSGDARRLQRILTDVAPSR